MKSHLLRVKHLTEHDRSAMFSLLSRHFEGVERPQFEQDLREKNWVILLKNEATLELEGFTTLLLYTTEFEDEKISVVYSGDTIVDPAAWSSSVLARSWVAAVKTLRHLYSEGKLYWLLISSGYRTYRFLPVFAREFYPRHDMTTPAEAKKLMNFLAQERFGRYYDPESGLVRFSHPQVLRSALRAVPQERLKDPHIQFFEHANAGHIRGDELVCLTEVCEQNLTPAGRRLWMTAQQEATAHLSSSGTTPER